MSKERFLSINYRLDNSTRTSSPNGGWSEPGFRAFSGYVHSHSDDIYGFGVVLGRVWP